MKTKLLIAIVFLGLCTAVSGQNNTISGTVYLDGMSNHSNIQIVFDRQAPNALFDTVYSDINGNYLINIENGIYDIYFIKDNYFKYILDDISLYDNTILPEITLFLRSSLILVPSVIPSVQLAIDEANSNDTILLSEGVFTENLIIDGKVIVLASNFIFTGDTSTISNTIIDGNLINRVIKISNVYSNECKIIGITIRNGKTLTADRNGGGIHCDHSSPTLTNLIIEGNITVNNGHGGGIYCDNSNPIIKELTVRNNHSDDEGGGIMLGNNSNATISNLTIHHNSAHTGGGISCESFSNPDILNSKIYSNSVMGGGGGIALEANSAANIENTLIFNNNANYCGGGISCYNSNAKINNVSIVNNYSNKGGGICLIVTSSPTITNCIIAFNTGNHGIMNSPDWPGNPIIQDCNFYQNEGQNFFNCGSYLGHNVTLNINGDSCDAFSNIQENPLFIDTFNNNFELDTFSSCIDAGDNEFVNQYGDIRDHLRIQDGNNDNIEIVDMGCYEMGGIIINDVIENIDDKYPILLYPNPSSSQITIELPHLPQKKTILTIYNLSGQQLITSQITEIKTVVDVSCLTGGVYFVKVANDEKVMVGKVIKE